MAFLINDINILLESFDCNIAFIFGIVWHKFLCSEVARSFPRWQIQLQLPALGSYCRKIIKTINLVHSSRKRGKLDLWMY